MAVSTSDHVKLTNQSTIHTISGCPAKTNHLFCTDHVRRKNRNSGRLRNGTPHAAASEVLPIIQQSFAGLIAFNGSATRFDQRKCTVLRSVLKTVIGVLLASVGSVIATFNALLGPSLDGDWTSIAIPAVGLILILVGVVMFFTGIGQFCFRLIRSLALGTFSAAKRMQQPQEPTA